MSKCIDCGCKTAGRGLRCRSCSKKGKLHHLFGKNLKPHPMLGKKHSKITKKKMSINHRDVSGKNNPMYGTISPMKNKRGKNHPRYSNGNTYNHFMWVEEVKERDNYTCQICGKAITDVGSKNIHAHHIKPKKEYPELMYELNNGITLCQGCHKKYENIPEKLVEKINEN